MNHQPFESWILEERTLSEVQRREMQGHLEICPKCAGIEKSWRFARQEVKSLPAIDAPAGFSHRFQASLAQRRKLHEAAQARVLLISLVSSAVAILITLGIFLLPHTSIISVMVTFLAALLKLVNSITQLWIFLTSILRSAPTGFLVGVGLISSFFISLLSIVWAFSFYRITTKGMKTTTNEI